MNNSENQTGLFQTYYRKHKSKQNQNVTHFKTKLKRENYMDIE